jgi:hypothetical protein
MDAITIEAEVGRDHRLVEPLPLEVPVGRVKLVIQPVDEPANLPTPTLTREEARRRWKAAGKTLAQPLIPQGLSRSSPSERLRLSKLLGQGPSSDQMIDEDRGPHE